MKAVSYEAGDSRPAIGILFILLVVVSITLTPHLPAALLEFWRQLVMWLAATGGKILGLSVTALADILTVNGFAMRITDECTAINYTIILSTAILMYAPHTLSYRFLGVLVAIPLIVAANAFRLIVTGLCGTVSWTLFRFAHEYLWVILFALLIFALWKIWADRRLIVTAETVKNMALVIVGSSAAFILLLAVLPAYGAFLASLSSGALKIFLDHGQVGITWAGSELQGMYGGRAYAVPLAVEYFNIAVFTGLVLPLQKKDDWRFFALCFFGLAGALLLNAFFIASLVCLMIKEGPGSINGFMLIGKGFLLAVPFALGWIVSCVRENRSRSGNV